MIVKKTINRTSSVKSKRRREQYKFVCKKCNSESHLYENRETAELISREHHCVG